MDRKKHTFLKYLKKSGKIDLEKLCERYLKQNFEEIKLEKQPGECSWHMRAGKILKKEWVDGILVSDEI